MQQPENDDAAFVNAIDEAIWVDQNLSDGWISALGNHPTSFTQGAERVRASQDPLQEFGAA